MSNYPKIFPVKHKSLLGKNGLLDGTVVVEEKVDGSFIRFQVDEKTKELHVWSKGQELILDSPPKMFSSGVETILSLKDKLSIGWTYYGEFLSKPHHNALTYSRVPIGNIVLFDVEIGLQDFLPQGMKKDECARLGLECVPCHYIGSDLSVEMYESLMDKESFLGGCKQEGIVVKNYQRFSIDGKILVGKLVSDDFKEVHQKEWKQSNPTQKDVISMLIEEHCTEARWNKAIIHLKEKDLLSNTPKDIGILVKEIQRDIQEECEVDIKEKLWNWASGHVLRGSINGFPQFYKENVLGLKPKESLTTETEPAIVDEELEKE